MKFRFNIDFVKYHVTDIEIYSFYKARLGDFRQYLYMNLSQSKLSGINRELLQLSEDLSIASRFSSDLNLVYKIMIYAIRNLDVFKDGSGEYYIGLKPTLSNPFCQNLSFDHLLRLIEFGHEKLKPLKLFRHSFIQFEPRAITLFDKQYGWRKESKKYK